MKTDELKTKLGNIKILDTVEEREMYSHDIGDIPPIMTKSMFKISTRYSRPTQKYG